MVLSDKLVHNIKGRPYRLKMGRYKYWAVTCREDENTAVTVLIEETEQ